MNNNFVRISSVALAILLIFHLSSCKDPVINDKGITSNPEDNINLQHADTTTIVLHTVQEQALLSSGISTGVLGSMDDPLFGKTYAGIYAQCLLSVNGVTPFKNDTAPTIDSAVLSMPFFNDSSFYGRCSKPVDVIVYELSQDMLSTVSYTHKDAFRVYSQPIGSKTNYVPDLLDSVPVQGINQSPQLSIRLSSNFAQKLFYSDSTSLSSSTDFINYFKGIYVTTSSSKVGNGLLYLNLQYSGITLYYHTPSGTQKTFNFPISAYSIASNHFDHNYSGYPIQSALSTAGNNPVAYIQSGGSTKVKMDIPYLNRILYPSGSDSINIAVTKAELIVPVGDTNGYPPPLTMKIYRYDDTMAITSFNSYNFYGTASLTTRLDNTGTPYLCYAFSLTEFIQRVLNHYYLNNGFYLTYSYTVRGDRVQIYNNPAIDARKTKLKITYTKLK